MADVRISTAEERKLTSADYDRAARVVNDPAVVGQYAACEWDELGDDDKTWVAAIVRAAQAEAGTPLDRFEQMVSRIARWTEEELAVVDVRQTRHIAQLVVAGAAPTYPPFAATANRS